MNLSIEQVATATKLSDRTIRRAEQSEGPLPLNPANAELLAVFFEGLGIDFFGSSSEKGEGVGYTLDGPARKKRKAALLHKLETAVVQLRANAPKV